MCAHTDLFAFFSEKIFDFAFKLVTIFPTVPYTIDLAELSVILGIFCVCTKAVATSHTCAQQVLPMWLAYFRSCFEVDKNPTHAIRIATGYRIPLITPSATHSNLDEYLFPSPQIAETLCSDIHC